MVEPFKWTIHQKSHLAHKFKFASHMNIIVVHKSKKKTFTSCIKMDSQFCEFLEYKSYIFIKTSLDYQFPELHRYSEEKCICKALYA